MDSRKKRERASSPRDDATARADPCAVGCDRERVLSRAKCVGELYAAKALCDAEVKLKGLTFPVSRMILASCSPFFRAAFTGAMRESCGTVDLDPSLDVACVETLLKLAHDPQDVHRVPLERLELLFATADQLQFEDILVTIAERLADTTCVSNCLERLVVGVRYLMPNQIVSTAIRAMDENFDSLALSSDFLSLPRDGIEALLRSDDLHTPELSLFNAALSWVAHDHARADEFCGLLELIRLPELGIECLVTRLTHSPAVLASKRAQELVRNALLFLAAPGRYAALFPPGTSSRHGQTQPLWVTFEIDDTVDDVLVSESGKVVTRQNCTFWKGARGTEVISRASRWTLRVAAEGRLAHGDELFVGVARDDVLLDDCGSTFITTGKLGFFLRGVKAGDTFTLAASPFLKTLSISAALVEARSKLPGLPLPHTLRWEADPGAVWKPFVQMNWKDSSIISLNE